MYFLFLFCRTQGDYCGAGQRWENHYTLSVVSNGYFILFRLFIALVFIYFISKESVYTIE